MIYFIKAVDGDAVKIGYCKSDPQRRRQALQTGHPARLELIAVIEGPDAGRLGEAAWHSRFAADRLQGEWFRWSPELRRAVLPYLTKHVVHERQAAARDFATGRFTRLPSKREEY